MEQLITRAIETLILPPGVFILLLAMGILLLNRRALLARIFLWVSLSGFYLCSTPIVAGFLIGSLESYPALREADWQKPRADAIVVLASGRDRNAREYGDDTVDSLTLVRTRYGAFLQRKTNLPILVSGGLVLDRSGKTLAQTMAHVLEEEFNAGTVWLEEESRTTGENAIFTQKRLSEKGVNSIYLVSHAWHMPRSVTAFRNAGLEVIPAPTAFEGSTSRGLPGFLPSILALQSSNRALHEIVGMLWYRIRY